MAKRNRITASIQVISNDVERGIDAVKKCLNHHFSKVEIGSVGTLEEFVNFEINIPTCIPLLMELFPTLQLYVNKKAVNMKLIKP